MTFIEKIIEAETAAENIVNTAKDKVKQSFEEAKASNSSLQDTHKQKRLEDRSAQLLGQKDILKSEYVDVLLIETGILSSMRESAKSNHEKAVSHILSQLN